MILYVDKQGVCSPLRPRMSTKPVVGPEAFRIDAITVPGTPVLAVITWLAEEIVPYDRYQQPQIEEVRT